MAYPDVWQETALVGITPIDGSADQYATITETIDIDMGDKDIEGITTIKGGRLTKFTPQADTSVTIELYPVDIGGQASGSGVAQLFHTTDANWDVSQPVSVNASLNREKYQVAVLLTEDSDVATAEAAATGNAYRFVFKNAYLTSYKPSYTDKVLKVTATFKVPAFNKAGTANITEESSDSGTTLVALSSYTS